MTKGLLSLGVALVLTVLDQFSKYLTVKYLSSSFHPVKITSFFQIVYVQNRGAAFGLFQSLGNWVFVLVSIVAIGIVVYIICKEKESPIVMALILSGAAGNLIDRLRFGYVVDFLDFHVGSYHWPAFNLADTYLSIGLILLFVKIVIADIGSRKEKRSQ